MKKTLVGAGALAAGVAWYNGQSPTSQLYGKTVARVPSAGKKICLTFDDGPNPERTPELMKILEQHNAKATFFSIGMWAECEPALLREMYGAGHAIGNHTFTHPTMALRTQGQLRDELRRCRAAVEAAGIEFSTIDGKALMRPPYGRRRPATMRVLAAEGYIPVTWSITCWDWREQATVESITNHALKAKDGDIILMHDGSNTEPAADRSKSLQSARNALDHFGAQGYEFVTVPQLVAAGS